jgi:hypothetical protein
MLINILHVIELIIIALLLLVSTTTSASSTLKNDDVYIPKRTLIPTVHDHSHSHDGPEYIKPGPLIDAPFITGKHGQKLHTDIVNGNLLVIEEHIIIGEVDDEGNIKELYEPFKPKVRTSRVDRNERRLGATLQHYNTWPGPTFWEGGYVPIHIQDSMVEPMLGNLMHAMEELEANTPVRFRIIENTTHPTQFSQETLMKKPLTMQEQKYLQKLEDSIAKNKSLGYMNVRSGLNTGCNAALGRTTYNSGGRIQFNNDGSCPHKTSVHELMHSLGFYHEQSRADRDAYVAVNIAAVKTGKEHNFYAYTGRNNYLGHDLFEYDYASVMHYPETAFLNTSTGFTKTITIDNAKKTKFINDHHYGNDFKVGSVDTLSKIDIQSLDATYLKCRNDVPFHSTIAMSSQSNNIADEIATVDEDKSTYPGKLDSEYAYSQYGSSALFDKDIVTEAYPYEDKVSGEKSWALTYSQVQYYQNLTINIDSNNGNCVDSIIIRWAQSPNGKYTIAYTKAGTSEPVVESRFSHQSYVLEEKLDYINFDECTNLEKLEIETGLSRTTRIAEIELLKNIVPDWVSYPFGPCVLKYDDQSKTMMKIRERSVHCRTDEGLCFSEHRCTKGKPAVYETCENQVSIKHWWDFDPKSFGITYESQKVMYMKFDNIGDIFKGGYIGNNEGTEKVAARQPSRLMELNPNRYSKHVFEAYTDLVITHEMTNAKCARMCSGYEYSGTYSSIFNERWCSCFTLKQGYTIDSISWLYQRSESALEEEYYGSMMSETCKGDMTQYCGGMFYANNDTGLADGYMTLSKVKDNYPTFPSKCSFEKYDKCDGLSNHQDWQTINTTKVTVGEEDGTTSGASATITTTPAINSEISNSNNPCQYGQGYYAEFSFNDGEYRRLVNESYMYNSKTFYKYENLENPARFLCLSGNRWKLLQVTATGEYDCSQGWYAATDVIENPIPLWQENYNQTLDFLRTGAAFGKLTIGCMGRTTGWNSNRCSSQRFQLSEEFNNAKFELQNNDLYTLDHTLMQHPILNNVGGWGGVFKNIRRWQDGLYRWTYCVDIKCNSYYGFQAAFSTVPDNVFSNVIQFADYNGNPKGEFRTGCVEQVNAPVDCDSKVLVYDDPRNSYLSGKFTVLDGHYGDIIWYNGRFLQYPILKHGKKKDRYFGIVQSGNTYYWKYCNVITCGSSAGYYTRQSPSTAKPTNIFNTTFQLVTYENAPAGTYSGACISTSSSTTANVKDVCFHLRFVEMNRDNGQIFSSDYYLSPSLTHNDQFYWANAHGFDLIWNSYSSWIITKNMGKTYNLKVDHNETRGPKPSLLNRVAYPDINAYNNFVYPSNMQVRLECVSGVTKIALPTNTITENGCPNGNGCNQVMKPVVPFISANYPDMLRFSTDTFELPKGFTDLPKDSCRLNVDLYFGETSPKGIIVLFFQNTRIGDLRSIATTRLSTNFTYDSDEMPGWRRISVPINIQSTSQTGPFTYEMRIQSSYNGYYGDIAVDNFGFTDSCKYDVSVHTATTTSKYTAAEIATTTITSSGSPRSATTTAGWTYNPEPATTTEWKMPAVTTAGTAIPAMTTTKWTYKPEPATTTKFAMPTAAAAAAATTTTDAPNNNGQCQSREELINECKEKRGRWGWTCEDPNLKSDEGLCLNVNHVLNPNGACVEICDDVDGGK